MTVALPLTIGILVALVTIAIGQLLVLICGMVGHYMSRERILEEIKKCDVFCANCHMKHHSIHKFIYNGQQRS